MKRLLSFFLLTAALILHLPSCSAQLPYTEGTGELKIVASSFVPFDLARSIAGGHAQVTVLQTDGSDLHDYTPTVAALQVLSEADIFVCIGGSSDELWINDAIKASGNSELTVIRLTDLVNGELAELEGHGHSDFCKENHGHNHEHEDEHGHTHSADDGHGHTADEHVWTSLRNSIKGVKKIAQICAEKDSENAPHYESSAELYVKQLTELDGEYAKAFENSSTKTLIFADRFPFVYLIKDYGACYFAAFSGCGGELDASFETAVRLTNAVRSNSTPCVIVTESSDKKLAKSISDATDCKIITLNSMQSVALSHIKNGTTYLDTMKSNLSALKAAL